MSHASSGKKCLSYAWNEKYELKRIFRNLNDITDCTRQDRKKLQS